jgi:ribosomal protein S27E
MSDELPEADFEGEWYKWRCPDCDYISESDIDERGTEVECDSCGERAYLPSAR